VSLIAGLVFLTFAVVYTVASLTDVSIDGRFVWPIVLVALGAAGIATAVTATKRDEKAFAELDTDGES
jgi:apolipoprotein N-acyltransferase